MKLNTKIRCKSWIDNENADFAQNPLIKYNEAPLSHNKAINVRHLFKWTDRTQRMYVCTRGFNSELVHILSNLQNNVS